MDARTTNYWDEIRSSYWFIPASLGVCALMLGIFMPIIDSNLDLFSLPLWLFSSADAAGDTLSAIAGALVAVTGTVISITFVTLSLTSQQFGPRLLRTFMLDYVTQVAIGVFLSTGLYCLLVLRVIPEKASSANMPHLSVALALVFLIISISVLIIFFHHTAMSIQAPSIIAAVSHELHDALNRLYPESIGEPGDKTEEEHQKLLSGPTFSVNSLKEGYIQAIDTEDLLSILAEEDVILKFHYRPGSYISTTSVLASLYGYNDVEVSSEFLKKINDCLIVGIRRTPRQDIECVIEELVEVAVRSLSPGINDPFTAISCIDYLGSAVAILAGRNFPSPNRYDDTGNLRLISDTTTFDGVVNAAFNQIRQNARNSVAVTIRLLEALRLIAKEVREEDRKFSLLRHADMIVRHSERNIPEEDDRKDIISRYHSLVETLDKKQHARR